MFTHYRTQGFVFKKEERGEADQLLTLYTKDFGRLEILGKAIRKIKSKLRGGIDLFCWSEVEFIQGKIYKTLTDALLLEYSDHLKKDLKKLALAYRLASVFDLLIKGQEPDEKIWQLLKEVFSRLNSSELESSKLAVLYYYFFWNLLSLLGYRPDLYYCSLCGQKLLPAKIYFNWKERGLFCQSCQKKTAQRGLLQLSPETIKLIRMLLEKDWSVLKRLKFETENFLTMKKLVSYYLADNLN